MLLSSKARQGFYCLRLTNQRVAADMGNSLHPAALCRINNLAGASEQRGAVFTLRRRGDDVTDRELLEAAARAAGMVMMYKGRESPGPLYWREGSSDFPAPWNPLTDDGDALRLAVKLRLCCGPNFDGDKAVVFGNDGRNFTEPYGDDPERATRRAIVRAVAAMAGEKT